MQELNMHVVSCIEIPAGHAQNDLDGKSYACDSQGELTDSTPQFPYTSESEMSLDTSCVTNSIRWQYARKFWKVGRFEDPDIGVSFGIGWRLDKNNTRDCFEITLTRDDKTVAYVLIELVDGTFALRGMNVYDEFRGKGLAGVLTALWLKLCFELDAPPSTKKIDKPVISLVLQKFGFLPYNDTTSVEVGLRPGENGEVVVWSAHMHRLRSQFSKRYLKTQNMIVSQEKPEESRTVFVNTQYVPPSMEALGQHVEMVLQKATLSFYNGQKGDSFAQFVSGQIAHLPAFHARRHAGLAGQPPAQGNSMCSSPT